MVITYHHFGKATENSDTKSAAPLVYLFHGCNLTGDLVCNCNSTSSQGNVRQRVPSKLALLWFLYQWHSKIWRTKQECVYVYVWTELVNMASWYFSAEWLYCNWRNEKINKKFLQPSCHIYGYVQLYLKQKCEGIFELSCHFCKNILFLQSPNMQNLIKRLLNGDTWKYRTLSQFHSEDSSKYWPSYVLLDWLDEDTDALLLMTDFDFK